VSPRSGEFLQAARRRLAAADEAQRAIKLAGRFLTAIEALLE
jgi:hypothetical protein